MNEKDIPREDAAFSWKGNVGFVQGGAVSIGVLTSSPPGGFGPAGYRNITIRPDGTWSATGEEISVTIPKL